MGLTEQLVHPDPRQRAEAARRVSGAVWDPGAEAELAGVLVEAACAEEDPGALEAQTGALVAVEGGISDLGLQRLGLVWPAPPVLERLLARAGRLQVSAPVTPGGAATLAVVRCLRGAPRTGSRLRTPGGAWVVLERIELYGRAVDRLDAGSTARVLLSGAGARGLEEWDRLEADPRARDCVRRMGDPDPRVRRLAAEEAADWPDAWDGDDGRRLCTALARAAVTETDPEAREGELYALLRLGHFASAAVLTLLRGLERRLVPPPLRPYLDDLLDERPPGDRVRQ
ncbi:hypothetical protein EDD96_1968 [Streptomyces sp. Ag109_G2-6]|uniref:hypothetical protein n=1 Tax=Streptomyces TaxID=1883 RepID=UPI000F4EF0FF|nr:MULTISPECIES: hypothetical protein [Streptomyces]RPF45409.1 hypothetical protein EDD96_1968 [Streptomyces sp. Ag109_G2-6]